MSELEIDYIMCPKCGTKFENVEINPNVNAIYCGNCGHMIYTRSEQPINSLMNGGKND